MHYFVFAWFVIVILLQMSDFYIRWWCFSKCYGNEPNPLVRLLIHHFGLVPGLVIAKAVAVSFTVYLYLTFHESVTYFGIMAALSILYAVLVWSNFKVLRKNVKIVDFSW